MKRVTHVFPEWIADLVPGDEVFARAYDQIPDHNRAWMKTAIARLYDWYGPRKVESGEFQQQWRADFTTRTRFQTVDFAVVLFDDSLLSSSRLLAALIPALAGGVKHVLAARVASDMPWPNSILTGLELGGQELVANVTEVQARRLFNELRETGLTGAVTVLGPRAAVIKTTELQAASRISFWRPRFSRAASVWMEEADSFDLEALAFTHPDIVFSVFGVEVEMPADNFSYEGDSFSECVDAIVDVAYLPEERANCALSKARLVLGPGQEGCWIWPDLHPEHFQFHSTVWTIGG